MKGKYNGSYSTAAWLPLFELKVSTIKLQPLIYNGKELPFPTF